jgi:hypothetical protein
MCVFPLAMRLIMCWTMLSRPKRYRTLCSSSCQWLCWKVCHHPLLRAHELSAIRPHIGSSVSVVCLDSGGSLPSWFYGNDLSFATWSQYVTLRCALFDASFRGGLIQKIATALLALGQPLLISVFELCTASIHPH